MSTNKTTTRTVRLDTYDKNFGDALRFLSGLSQERPVMGYVCNYNGDVDITIEVTIRVALVWDAIMQLAFSPTDDEGYDPVHFKATVMSTEWMALTTMLDALNT